MGGLSTTNIRMLATTKWPQGYLLKKVTMRQITAPCRISALARQLSSLLSIEPTRETGYRVPLVAERPIGHQWLKKPLTGATL
jgi:hypothetical protein